MKRICLLFVLLSLSFCSARPTPEGGAVVGGVVGAGAGSIVGGEFGKPGTGALIGAATGAGVGAVVGAQDDSDQEKLDAQKDILWSQEREKQRQKAEIQQIRRQEYWDQRLKKHGE